MIKVNVNDFNEENTCVYKEETYSVRDNGAVLRHSKKGGRNRKNDDIWTFGEVKKTGYMEIASKRVHRIVATAFYGDPPTSQHVVDHIDTNRKNNRPENLRWVTKLENILLNPITCKKIEQLCNCPIKKVLNDISILQKHSLPPDISWMRTVSQKEADKSLKRWLKWSKQPKRSNAGRWFLVDGEWHIEWHIKSKTKGAVQRNWKTPSEFPCCPTEVGNSAIESYEKKLKAGSIFSRDDYGESVVMNFSIYDNGQSILVSTETEKIGSIKPWALARITYEDDLYVHENKGSFFANEGMQKQFFIQQGLEWEGEDSIDNYC